MLELREEVKWYLSFTNEEVFWGVALPEKEEEESLKTLSATDVTKTPCVLEPSPEERAPTFLGLEKVLHPSQPVVATGEIPQPTEASRPKVGSCQLSQMIPIRPTASPPGTPLHQNPLCHPRQWCLCGHTPHCMAFWESQLVCRCQN